ncbi:hypothetical protein M9Y10_009646 [Tritrichomonas musculus]|uniref:Uncharacterized protein n=1 Tax=Tritrichomonas musculus TaxID=1915356 RepID=A0ABR2IQA6_9EUKA
MSCHLKRLSVLKSNSSPKYSSIDLRRSLADWISEMPMASTCLSRRANHGEEVHTNNSTTGYCLWRATNEEDSGPRDNCFDHENRCFWGDLGFSRSPESGATGNCQKGLKWGC